MEQRFCQQCSKPTWVEESLYSIPPCRCGSTIFDIKPAPHKMMKYQLSTADITFLRIQGIDPEDF